MNSKLERRRLMATLLANLLVSSTILPLCSAIFPLPALAQFSSRSGKVRGILPVPPGQGGAPVEFTLAEADAPVSRNEPAKKVASSNLPAGRAAEILKSLKPFAESKKPTFVLPEDSLIKPRLPGNRIVETFPPAASSVKKPQAANISTPLTVSRISHTGNTDIDQLAVTFSQPVTSIAQVGTVEPSKLIALTPRPKGSWQWAGTQTLLFKPEGTRFPRSTQYVVKVPAGATSVNGSKVERDVVYTITTPSVQIESFAPTPEPAVDRTPLFFTVFNQEIDARKILAKVHVQVGKTVYETRLLSAEEVIKKAPQYKEQVAASNRNWLAFEATTAFERDSQITISFDKGLPSAEGPRLSEAADKRAVRVYGQFKLKKNNVEGGAGPDSSVNISFSNEIEPTSDLKNLVSVTPAVERFQAAAYGAELYLRGDFKAQAHYKVSVSKNLKDRFGQTLGVDQSVQINTGVLPRSINSDRPLKTYTTGSAPQYTAWVQGAAKVKVEICQVSPQDYPKFKRNFNESRPDQIGKSLAVKTFDIGANGRQLNIDLKPYLNGPGHIFVRADLDTRTKDDVLASKSWIQVTNIGLDLFCTDNLQILTTSLKDATPLAGVELQILGKSKTSSDSNGQATLPFEANSISEGVDVLVGRKGKDSAILLPQDYNDQWNANVLSAETKWYTVCDRNLYKAGENVNIKGWLRNLSYSEKGGLKLTQPNASKISYSVHDPVGVEIASGSSSTDAAGGFSFKFDLPAKITLGQCQVLIKTGEKFPSANSQEEEIAAGSDSQTSLSIRVDEFRRPEFEMKVSRESSNNVVQGDSAKLTAEASYLVGGKLSDSPVDWSVRPNIASYDPPGWPGFNFNFDYGFNTSAPDERVFTGIATEEKKLLGTTDSSGKDTLAIKFISAPYPVVLSYHCQATVSDVNRQNWTDGQDIIVHPASACVGIKADKSDYKPGELATFEIIACDLDGKIMKGPVDVEIVQIDSQQNKTVSKSIVQIGDGAAKVEARIAATTNVLHCRASVKDSQGRLATADTSNYINSQEKVVDNVAVASQIELKADKLSYKPGEVAQIKIKAPFQNGRGILIITRNRDISRVPVVMHGDSETVSIPITEDYYPVVRATVYLAASATTFGSATLELSVPPEARKLALTAKPHQSVYAPGEEATVEVELKYADGKPVANGQIALAVVDESVLALTGYSWPQPLDFFYPANLPGFIASFIRSTAIEAPKQDRSDLSTLPPPSALPGPGMPGVMAESAAMGGAGMMPSASPVAPQAMMKSRGLVGAPVDPRYGQSNEVGQLADYATPQLTLRQDFSALALFQPVVTTDKDGRAQVTFKLPDSVTRYRIMAIATADDNCFGSTDSLLTVQMPLMVKPSAPRFLQLADQCELPVVIQNQTEHDMQTEVAIRGKNIEIVEDGKLVTVPANDRVEVRFPIKASGVGQAQFQCAAICKQLSDAAEFDFPVLIPASSESFAAYGVIDQGAAQQKMEELKGVRPEFGGLSVETSTTALQALTDAFIYMRDYQNNCSEQLSSRLIALLSLEDSLTAFGVIKGEKISQLHSLLQGDIDTLQTRQNSTGGFGLWSANEDKAWPYVSIQVCRALHLAQEKKYVVKSTTLEAAQNYLRNVDKYIPSDYVGTVRNALLARALNVRFQQGDIDAPAAARLLQKEQKATGKQVSVEMACWLLVILDKKPQYSSQASMLRDLINKQIKETASTASANDNGYGAMWDYCVFASPRRTDAAVLEAWMEDQPDSALIPKFVKGLLAHRKNGLWEGTQENGYILQALDRYFHTYEREVPDLKAQTWLDDKLAANSQFVGRTADTKITTVPMSYLLENKVRDILVNKEGKGRLYYRLALNYVPQSLKLSPLDQGFTVSRKYVAVENKDDVRQDEKGIWHFKAGAPVKVKLHFSAPGTRYHVALADPIPAGAEPVNLNLLGSRGAGKEVGVAEGDDVQPFFRWWWRPWYEHSNLRDHQAEAFTSLLTAGGYDFDYTIQASTPGHFTVPPTKVEEMYMSETFGRGQTEEVIIE